MDIEQFRKAGYAAIDAICDYHASIPSRDVVPSVAPGYLRAALPTAAPEHGEDWATIAQDYQDLVVPGLTRWQHPKFFAYFPTSGNFESILGELYAASASNPGFNWLASPACTELEAVMMDWSAKLLGLSAAFLNEGGVGGGVMMTSASDSSLTAITAARTRYIRHIARTSNVDIGALDAAHPGTDSSADGSPHRAVPQPLIYTTTQTHSIGLKAGLVLNLAVRALPVYAEDQYALRGDTLRKALEEDERAGRGVCVLIATIGTTSSGAVDNVKEIAEVAKDYPHLWIHIDAAWAGMAFSCPELRPLGYLDEINACEGVRSFCVNFHKWGLVAWDASTLWVRDRKELTDVLDVTPEFLRTKEGDAGTVIDYRNWHLGLGRRFRSLKLWFVLRSYGVEGFRAHIRKCIALNSLFAALIEESPIFELVTAPSFALSVFRLIPGSKGETLSESKGKDREAGAEAALNALNRAFHTALSARTDILLTQTTLDGTFCLRFAVGSQRSEEVDVKWAFGVAEEVGKGVLAGLDAAAAHGANV
ncbi:hypothetical protein FIBSPDRAFT_891589 [Athelia psychrophila]|uniref:PLP-dependent transferase n=1 Tax=Athelia psychrophila TaxID=1759441 RepID=A0A166JLJ3_9AGAM|nr:hypothetical protein FIBSPDRAFT_891589 [Fibularhizoctonia sp. CBS 109695]